MVKTRRMSHFARASYCAVVTSPTIWTVGRCVHVGEANSVKSASKLYGNHHVFHQIQWDFLRLASGKRLHNWNSQFSMGNLTISYYFYGHFPWQTLSQPTCNTERFGTSMTWIFCPRPNGHHMGIPPWVVYIWLIYLLGGFNLSEKYESQLGWLFPIYGKIKNVPNHQSDMVCRWIIRG